MACTSMIARNRPFSGPGVSVFDIPQVDPWIIAWVYGAASSCSCGGHAGETDGCPIAAGRQQGPPANRAQATVVGVSAFAFQGTNAHALIKLEQPEASHITDAPGNQLWRRERVWYLPPLNGFLAAGPVHASSAEAAYAIRLSQPSLSFLCDHQVRN